MASEDENNMKFYFCEKHQSIIMFLDFLYDESVRTGHHFKYFTYVVYNI